MPERTRVVLMTAAAGLAAAGVAIGPAQSALAAGTGHTVTMKQSYHGQQDWQDVNPCTDAPLAFSGSTNMVNHLTYFPGPDGTPDELWGTFTEEDNFTAVDEASGVVYRGHQTAWGNYNLNEKNANQTFTFSAHATGSDGSTITGHEVMHVTLRPDGTVAVSFDRMTLTCG